jgi:hypothetical protein
MVEITFPIFFPRPPNQQNPAPQDKNKAITPNIRIQKRQHQQLSTKNNNNPPTKQKQSRLQNQKHTAKNKTTYHYTSSTPQGGGGSFKKRKPIGEVGCCESRMAARSR